jgi:Galactose oxidase-like, Early set domain/Glyoxal oxidase N-terminus
MSIIDTKYGSLDAWVKDQLGAQVSADVTLADGSLSRSYERGAILSKVGTGQAFAVYGAIFARYSADGGSIGSGYGYPVTDELDAIRGRVSHFELADIYWDRLDAYVVFPSPPPCEGDEGNQGRWEIAPFTSGVIGVHAALLHTNQVLFWSFRPLDDPNANPSPPLYAVSAVVDLSTGSILHPSYEGPLPDLENIFCAGHAFLADGRLLVVGGDREGYVRSRPVQAIHEFVPGGPGGGHWHYLGDMREPRFYPSATTLPDGRVLIVGGMAANDIPPARANSIYEIYDRRSGLAPETGVLSIIHADGAANYPFVVVLPNRKAFVHVRTTTQFINLDRDVVEAETIEAAARPDRASRTYGVEGTCVLLPLRPHADPPYRARLMMIGGGGPDSGIGAPATTSCEVLDTAADSLEWRLTAPMGSPRVMPDSVLLPDGKVFVCGGSSRGQSDNAASPVYASEVFDPETAEWTAMCSSTVPRLYHATALLLPDGRVMTAGTDGSWNPPPYNVGEFRIELFSPPYLFAGPRPVIENAPAGIRHQEEFIINAADSSSITEVVLVRCGSVTHSFNFNQRLVELTISCRLRTGLVVEAPPHGYVAPPGFYLLFVLREHVPSVGRFIQLAPNLRNYRFLRPDQLLELGSRTPWPSLAPIIDQKQWQHWPPPPPPPPPPDLNLDHPVDAPKLLSRDRPLGHD